MIAAARMSCFIYSTESWLTLRLFVILWLKPCGKQLMFWYVQNSLVHWILFSVLERCPRGHFIMFSCMHHVSSTTGASFCSSLLMLLWTPTEWACASKCYLISDTWTAYRGTLAFFQLITHSGFWLHTVALIILWEHGWSRRSPFGDLE